MLKFVRPVIGAVALAGCLPAFADTVIIDDFVFNPPMIVTVGTPSFTGRAGQLEGTFNGDPFLTYCTDILQQFAFDSVYNNYSVIDGVTAWGAQKSSDLNRLMSLAILNGEPTSSAGSAVLQTAIWEIIFETSATYDFNAGTFKASSADIATQTALNAFLWGDVLGATITHTVDKLFSPTRQDFMVITPTPEPSTLGLMGAALIGITTMIRRRKAQA